MKDAWRYYLAIGVHHCKELVFELAEKNETKVDLSVDTLQAAMRARVPIVPVCVVGAEEAAPIFAQLGLMRRLTGLLYFPLTPTFPHFGLLGMLGYLPAKFKLRFLPPIRFDEEGMYDDKALVQTVAHEIRAGIQENLWDMLAERKSVWFG